MSEIYKCPACKGPLMEAITCRGHSVWCKHGTIACKSLKANFGADGRTVEEAFAKLERAVWEEMEELDKKKEFEA